MKSFVQRWQSALTIAFLCLVLFGLPALAQTVAQQDDWSLVSDGSAASGTPYGRVMAGWDGSAFQFMSLTSNGYVEVSVGGGGSFGVAADDDSSFTHGTGDITPAGFIYDDTLSNDPEENDVALARMDSKRAVVNRIEGETRGVSADVLTLGADDTVNTTNGLFTYSALLGYESVGGVWDRLRMDTSGNLYVSLATALDSSIDSISIAVNDVIPQMDSTDRMAVSIYGFNAAAGDTQPTVTTTQADNLALTLDTLNVSAFLYAYDGTNMDLVDANSVGGLNVTLELDNGTNISGGSGGDDQTSLQMLNTWAAALGYDEDDTNYDRIYSYDTDGDNVATEAEGVTLATTNFPMVYDTPGAVFDRMSTGMVAGYGVTGATPDRATITNATTNAAVDLAVGYYQIQIIADTTDTVFCVQDAAAGSTASATSDMPYVAGLVYRVQVNSTSLDSFECITSAGQAYFYITPFTF